MWCAVTQSDSGWEAAGTGKYLRSAGAKPAWGKLLGTTRALCFFQELWQAEVQSHSPSAARESPCAGGSGGFGCKGTTGLAGNETEMSYKEERELDSLMS